MLILEIALGVALGCALASRAVLLVEWLCRCGMALWLVTAHMVRSPMVWLFGLMLLASITQAMCQRPIRPAFIAPGVMHPSSPGLDALRQRQRP